MDLSEEQSLGVTQIFIELQEKLKQNLKVSLLENIEKLSQVEIKARAFAILGQVIREKTYLSQSQKEITTIFDEVFADVVTSVYLAGCSLDKPAQTLLRRVLELGVAIIYLWDMPHQFWAWKCHDKDLNFNEMIDYLNSASYTSFILGENYKKYTGFSLEVDECKKIYRTLSNTIHGKISTFESVLPDRFNHNSADWQKHLDLVTKVQNILLHLWENRFSDSFFELEKRLPSLSRLQ
ncbi:hypothetical protein H6F74_15060 [Trichocoleus sp. FACHB-90]|uniref:hypothetical protein n=1 Tax=Cyanophyceae TaxID=3028117 RepID=UPI001684759B|nr:hypothetical protein [Trichocoleus sp. FACHB-90]MBD1927553.1 hypothetical protein [Trichocoleus sp. FACHB-90]